MAFDRTNISGGIGAGSNAPKLYTFVDTTSTKAQIATADYFLSAYDVFEVGDIILCGGSDGTSTTTVTASSNVTVTVSGLGATGSFVSDGAVSTITVTDGIITAIV